MSKRPFSGDGGRCCLSFIPGSQLNIYERKPHDRCLRSAAEAAAPLFLLAVFIGFVLRDIPPSLVLSLVLSLSLALSIPSVLCLSFFLKVSTETSLGGAHCFFPHYFPVYVRIICPACACVGGWEVCVCLDGKCVCVCLVGKCVCVCLGW